MPVTCCRTASATPINSTTRAPDLNSSARLPVSRPMASLISRNSVSAAVGPFTRVRMRRARSVWPWASRKRGVSGTKNSKPSSNTAGSASEANIHRQPVASFQAWSPCNAMK